MSPFVNGKPAGKGDGYIDGPTRSSLILPFRRIFEGFALGLVVSEFKRDSILSDGITVAFEISQQLIGGFVKPVGTFGEMQ